MSFGLSFPYLFIYSISAVAIIFSLILVIWLLLRSFDERKIGEVILHSRKGLFFYALRHFSLVAISSFVISSFLYQLFNVTSALGFLFGVFVSLLISYVGMIISFIASLRQLHALQRKDEVVNLIALKSLLSTGFLSLGVFLAGITGFYQYTQDMRGLISLGLGVAFIGLITKVSFSIFAQSLKLTDTNQRNPALYAQFVALGMRGTVREIVTLFEVSTIALMTSLLLGLRLFHAVNQPSQLFLITAVLFALGTLSSLIAGVITVLRPASSLFQSFQRTIALTSVLFALSLISVYHYLSLPAQFYNSATILVFFIGLLAINLLLLLLNQIRQIEWMDMSNLQEIRFSSSFALIFLLVAILLLASLLLVPGYGLVLLLISLYPLMAFLPLMGSAQPQLQSVYELAAIIPASRRAQNDIKALVQDTRLLPVFHRHYLSLIMVLISLILVAALSATTTNLGVIDTRLIAGIFAGGAGVYFLAQSMSNAIRTGIELVESEMLRLAKKVRSKKVVLPDYEGFSSRVSFYAYRRALLPICLPLIAVLVGGGILGSQFLIGLLLGALFCGTIFTFSARSEESVQEVIGGVIHSLILLTGFISLLLLSFFS